VSQMNPVHILNSCLSEIHFDIILPFKPRSSELFCNDVMMAHSYCPTCTESQEIDFVSMDKQYVAVLTAFRNVQFNDNRNLIPCLLSVR
jgi:hypothetical protein